MSSFYVLENPKNVPAEIMRLQAHHFWGEDLIQAVLAILYQVLHSFYRVFWVMRLGQKIKGLIGDPTEALHGFQWNKQEINPHVKLFEK